MAMPSSQRNWSLFTAVIAVQKDIKGKLLEPYPVFPTYAICHAFWCRIRCRRDGKLRLLYWDSSVIIAIRRQSKKKYRFMAEWSAYLNTNHEVASFIPCTSTILNVDEVGTGSTQPHEDNWELLGWEVANLIRKVDFNRLDGA